MIPDSIREKKMAHSNSSIQKSLNGASGHGRYDQLLVIRNRFLYQQTAGFLTHRSTHQNHLPNTGLTKASRVSGCAFLAKSARNQHSLNTVTRSHRIHTCFPFNPGQNIVLLFPDDNAVYLLRLSILQGTDCFLYEIFSIITQQK